MGSWVTGMDFPHARSLVEVMVWGTETEGPSTDQQAVWRNLMQQYAEIDPFIEEALYDELEMVLNTGENLCIDDSYLSDEYRPNSPAEIWRIAHPVTIDIYRQGYSSEYDCRIYYAFPVDREHNRSAFLQESKLVLVMPE